MGCDALGGVILCGVDVLLLFPLPEFCTVGMLMVNGLMVRCGASKVGLLVRERKALLLGLAGTLYVGIGALLGLGGTTIVLSVLSPILTFIEVLIM